MKKLNLYKLKLKNYETPHRGKQAHSASKASLMQQERPAETQQQTFSKHKRLLVFKPQPSAQT